MDRYESLFIEEANHFSNIFQTLSILRDCDELCDVTLRADNGLQTPAHKVVLSACSPYFRCMFTTGFLEVKQPIIDIKDVDGYALQDIIDFFYSGKLHVHYMNVESIVKLANVLQLDDLMEKCEVYLRRNMSTKNSLGLQAFGQQYSLTNLKEHALRYSCWNFDSVKEEEEFLLLPCDCLKQLLENDTLKVASEEFVFEALVKWLSFDYENRQQHIPDLLQYIRFPLMSINYLRESSLVKFLLSKYPSGESLIQQAIKYQQGLNKEVDVTLFSKLSTPRAASEDIYVIGGWSNGQKISTVQCFNVDTLKWEPVQNMTVAHVAEKDYIRVIVSYDELYTICFDKVMKYDPVDSQWHKVAPGPEIQCKWAGVCECNGEIYVIGGNSWKISKKFVTDTCEWKDLPLMNIARYYPGVGVMHGKIYVIGGLDNRWYPLRYCEVFDPATTTWHNISRMKAPRWSLGVAVLRNRVYAIGGSHNQEQFANTIEVYDPGTDTWERSISPLNYGRRCLGVAVVNGSIYVVGGRSANTIECYNEDQNEWKVIGSVKTCCNFGCVALRII